MSWNGLDSNIFCLVYQWPLSLTTKLSKSALLKIILTVCTAPRQTARTVEKTVWTLYSTFGKQLPRARFHHQFSTKIGNSKIFSDLCDPKSPLNRESSHRPPTKSRFTKNYLQRPNQVKAQLIGRTIKDPNGGKNRVLRSLFTFEPCNFQAPRVFLSDSHIHLNSQFKILAQNNFNPICLFCKFQDNAHNFKRHIDDKRHKKFWKIIVR